MIRTRFASPPVPEFTPVPRQPRAGGWTPERQRAFIANLAATGSVTAAADMLGLHSTAAYKLRAAPGSDSFRQAWNAALDTGVAALRALAFDRAVNGVPVQLTYHGKVRGTTTRHDNRLLMSVLRQYEVKPGSFEPEIAAQVEPTDRAVRLWHNSLRYFEQLCIDVKFRAAVLEILQKVLRRPDSLAEFTANYASHSAYLKQRRDDYRALAHGGPDAFRNNHGNPRDKISWKPLSESQRFRGARVLATLAGQPGPEGDIPMVHESVASTSIANLGAVTVGDGAE